MNTVAFAGNNAPNRYDVLGLILPPADMPVPNLCTYCTCLRADVSFHPGSANDLEWGWYVDFNGTITFGNAIHVVWEVLGVGSKCKYFQIESGYIRAHTDNELSFDKTGNWNKTTKLPRSYWDHMGLKFNSWDTGHWTIRTDAPLTIKLRCESSDGTAVEQDIPVPTPPDGVNFPPPLPLPQFPGK